MNTKPNTEVHYLDGTTEKVTVSMFDRMAAEKYAIAQGWGGGVDSPIRQAAYAVYFSLRRSGKLTGGLAFDDWAETVEQMPDVTEPDDPTEYNGDPLAEAGPKEA